MWKKPKDKGPIKIRIPIPKIGNIYHKQKKGKGSYNRSIIDKINIEGEDHERYKKA